MALWMEAGSEPKTESELVDLQAINSLKESATVELKEQGNQYVKKGRKHYSDALDCYTRAINQKALSDAENSILYANRAHVNLLLGNHRRALTDAEEAIKLCPTSVKAIYRAAKASLSLNLLTVAKAFIERGLELDPGNDGMKKLATLTDFKKSEQEQHELQASKALTEAKDLVAAFENRGLKLGKAVFQELTGLRKPVLDKNNTLHWPVLLLYAEVMTSDFIEDFCETDVLSVHLDMMFSDSGQPLSWDKDNRYTREAIDLYYEANAGVCLSKRQLMRYLLEGTAGCHVQDTEDGKEDETEYLNGGIYLDRKWVKVNQNRTLKDVLKDPSFVILGIPVFYVVSKGSSFYKEFSSGKWTPP